MDDLADDERKYLEAVADLYPCEETVTGGVKASHVADYVGISEYWAARKCKRLAERGHLQQCGGLRGPTYAPVD